MFDCSEPNQLSHAGSQDGSTTTVQKNIAVVAIVAWMAKARFGGDYWKDSACDEKRQRMDRALGRPGKGIGPVAKVMPV